VSNRMMFEHTLNQGKGRWHGGCISALIGTMIDGIDDAGPSHHVFDLSDSVGHPPRQHIVSRVSDQDYVFEEDCKVLLRRTVHLT
jgi:hypothetical protein